MRTIIICRFETKQDLESFNNINGLELTSNTIEYNVNTKVIKTKKNIIKKEINEDWRINWFDMPEYVSNKQVCYARIDFIFNDGDLEIANQLFNQKISDRTTSVWFPKLVQGKHASLRVVGGSSVTKYPVYVVSKGRFDKCSTSKYLSRMEVPHYVVVEPSEFSLYVENVENEYAKIVELDMTYKDEYDTFDELGGVKGKGPGGARNFCWDHSIRNGYEWHWVMDDNLNEGFHYMNYNRKQKCRTGEIFRACEHFVDRYENIAISGLNYSKFCKESDKTPAFVLNTRIYSCLLIRNDISYRWRGRYNEDTDLSLNVLKDGWCTVQFNAFLAGKVTTQKVSGGNTDEFYSIEGTLPKSQMLKDMHPDVTEVVWKFNRWHHIVDYSKFTQKLKLKIGIDRNIGINNFNMVVIDTTDEISDSKTYLEAKYLN